MLAVAIQTTEEVRGLERESRGRAEDRWASWGMGLRRVTITTSESRGSFPIGATLWLVQTSVDNLKQELPDTV